MHHHRFMFPILVHKTLNISVCLSATVRMNELQVLNWVSPTCFVEHHNSVDHLLQSVICLHRSAYHSLLLLFSTKSIPGNGLGLTDWLVKDDLFKDSLHIDNQRCVFLINNALEGVTMHGVASKAALLSKRVPWGVVLQLHLHTLNSLT